MDNIKFNTGDFAGRSGEVLTQYMDQGMTHVLIYGSPEVEATVPETDYEFDFEPNDWDADDTAFAARKEDF